MFDISSAAPTSRQQPGALQQPMTPHCVLPPQESRAKHEALKARAQRAVARAEAAVPESLSLQGIMNLVRMLCVWWEGGDGLFCWCHGHSSVVLGIGQVQVGHVAILVLAA
jgi:hypothetical protein